MSEDISGYGLEVNVIGSLTFPVGFTITEFADDADPFDTPEIQLADTAMGLNGDLVSWNTPNPIEVAINVIPGSEDDINLSILAEANRSGKGKRAIVDKITMSRTFPGEAPLILTNGKIVSAIPVTGVASSGRKKSKPYIFRFENKVGLS